MKAQTMALENSKQDWAGAASPWRGYTRKALYVMACAAFTLCAPASASAAKQTYTYKVYAGGVDAVRAHLTIDETPDDTFKIKLEAYTRGFLAKLAPWKGSFASTSRMESGVMMPQNHTTVGTWRDEVETKEYRYGADGQFKDLIITEHEKAPQTKTPSAALTKDTTDMLSATLDMLTHFAQNGNSCNKTANIFDGKRRFKLMFTDKERVTLQANKYNKYDGAATMCTVEISPDGGAWHDKPRGWLSIQEQGRERGTMPTIWVAQPAGYDHAVPVKVRVKTDYGTLFMHLTKD